jgi:hypothetical protein
MAVTAKVQLIDRDVIFRATSGLSPQDQSRAVAAYARRIIADADAQNARAEGHSVPKKTFVDGRVSADFESVRPGGVIVAEWDIGLELIQWIFEQLQMHSPVKTGRYKASIAVYADGEEIEDMAHPPEASEYAFVPLVPYARKIERGESKQAPDGVFEAVAALAAARFGNIARIQFSYRNPIGGASELEAWAGKHAAKIASHVARRRQHSADTRQPAIIVTLT